jgi:hypothetical protein
MTQNPTVLAALAVLNQSKQILKPTAIRVKGVNFMTPVALGTWKVVDSPYAIEISEGIYPDGAVMYGLTVFDVSKTGVSTDLSRTCDTGTLIESLQDIINHINYSQRKYPHA